MIGRCVVILAVLTCTARSAENPVMTYEQAKGCIPQRNLPPSRPVSEPCGAEMSGHELCPHAPPRPAGAGRAFLPAETFA